MLTVISLILIFFMLVTLFLMCGKLYNDLKQIVSLIGDIITVLTEHEKILKEKEDDRK